MKIPKILLFNFLSKIFLSQVEQMPIISRRIKSVLADFSYSIVIFLPLLLLFMVPSMIYASTNFDPMEGAKISAMISALPFTLMIIVILNKDFFNTQSVAKRIYGYQIFDYKTKKLASRHQTMIRNMTMIIWPIEAIFLILKPSRRLGDYIAGTFVDDSKKSNPELIMNDISNYKRDGSNKKTILISIGYAIFFDLYGFGMAFL